MNEGFALLLRTEVVVTVTYRLFEYQPFAEGEFLHRGYQGSIGRSHVLQQWRKAPDY